MRYPLPIATYRHVSPRASSARLVNVYAEQAPQDGQKAPALLRRSPGITTLATIGDGPIRGATVMGGVPYIVSGDEMFSFDEDVANAGDPIDDQSIFYTRLQIDF